MRTAKRTRRIAILGFGGGIALVCALAVVGVRDASDATDAVARVERSHTIIESLEEVSAQLGEARSARRAYGLTGDITYRQTFEHAVESVPQVVARLRELTHDNAAQEARVAELQPLVKDRIDRMQAQLALREATGKDPRLDDAQSLANGRLDDSIRRILSDVIGTEHDLLRAHEDESRARFQRSQIVSTVGAASAILLLLTAFGVVMREVQQRRRAEAAARASLSVAEALNGELESFSYSVSHDLRAPLRAIDGFSQALLEDSADKLDEDSKRHLDRVRAATQRMGQLIDDLLALSRVSRAKIALSDADLAAIAKASADDLREANKDRDVKVTIAEDLGVYGDPRLLRIALDNLLGNAFKFTAKKSSAEIEVGVKEEGGERSYFVRDNGAGFDQRYADKLFGAFQRLHDARDFPGTGIGLATVQRIVRMHGGRLWAKGEVDHGATFFFTLNDEAVARATTPPKEPTQKDPS